MSEKHLISVDEMRAAGALYVPPEWRKSLGGQVAKKKSSPQLNLFADLSDDADTPPDEPRDADEDESAAE